ncbi:hypothetical protein [Parasediminibacterium sp. JCM 36343]|uniref:hypothetical protein n=1 Tax=Parasediminibacterium sp. JCM 36343 TaxID=3374279 RepID=UPI00397B0E24
MENDILLYNQFLIKKNIYNLNVGFWSKKLKKILQEKISAKSQFIKNKNELGFSFYDGNPIFSYYDTTKSKALRIIQEDPMEIKNFNEIKLIDAWIDKVNIAITSSGDGIEVQELVISLFLTRNSADVSLELIKNWFFGTLTENTINDYVKLSTTDSISIFPQTHLISDEIYK